MGTQKRMYAGDVRWRLTRLRGLPHIKIKELGQVTVNADEGNTNSFETAPLFQVVADARVAEKKHDVLLSAGVHGDEPAGVWALLKFLEDGIQPYLSKFRFFVYPCVNPYGYIHDTRNNWGGIDMNRDFRLPPRSKEALLVMDSLHAGPSRYSFTMDLHEWDTEFENEEYRAHGFTKENNPNGFCLWEFQNDSAKRISQKILSEISAAGIPVSAWPKNTPFLNDVNSFDKFLHERYTDHSFTVETISDWDAERRIQAHLIAVETALEEYKNR